MHEVYNNIFLHKGSGAKSAKGPVERIFEPALRVGQKAWSRMIYGPDTEIFDRIGRTDWRRLNVLLFNHPVPGNAKKCPRTVELLQGIPGVQSALFSVINPGAYIPPHSDPGKGVIRYHLALRVPRPVQTQKSDGTVSEERKCFIEINCDRGRGARDFVRRYSPPTTATWESSDLFG